MTLADVSSCLIIKLNESSKRSFNNKSEISEPLWTLVLLCSYTEFLVLNTFEKAKLGETSYASENEGNAES